MYVDVEDGKQYRTYNRCANEAVLEYPASGNIRDADPTVSVCDVPEEVEKRLEEVPGAPRPQNHIEILSQCGV